MKSDTYSLKAKTDTILTAINSSIYTTITKDVITNCLDVGEILFFQLFRYSAQRKKQWTISCVKRNTRCILIGKALEKSGAFFYNEYMSLEFGGLAEQVCDIVAKDEFTAAESEVTLFALLDGRLGARRGRRADAAKVHRERRAVPSGSIRRHFGGCKNHHFLEVRYGHDLCTIRS